VPISVDCVAGPAEQLDHGSCGMLVPPDDPALFADAMYRIATDDPLWLRLQTAGIEYASRFDVPSFVEAWAHMLTEVRDARRRAAASASAGAVTP